MISIQGFDSAWYNLIILKDLSEWVPKINGQKGGRIPSVWQHDEVEAILTEVDRSAAHGKRDYAILLLAVKLGMRVSDIRNLRLENLLLQ